jgi:hypothetical protein
LELCQLGYGYFDGSDCLHSAWHCSEMDAEKGRWIMQVINVPLLKHPMNWLTVFFMLTIAAIAGHEILSLAKIEPTTGS